MFLGQQYRWQLYCSLGEQDHVLHCICVWPCHLDTHKLLDICHTSNCKVLLHYEFSFRYQEKLYIVSANMSNVLLIKICSGVSVYI